MEMEIIDEQALARLKEVIGGSEEDLHELIDDFEETAPDLLQGIKAAIDANDLTALRIASHSLKSNAREFGADTLARLCATLEKQCHDEALENPGEQAVQIEVGLSDARQALREFKARNE